MTKIAGRIILLLLIFGACEFSVLAQRGAHLNLGNIIAEMPETKRADSELQTYQNKLIEDGNAKLAQFQDDSASFITQVQNGEISPTEQQKRQAELEKRRAEVSNFEGEIERKVAEKRNELLAPIFKKVGAVITSVARENGLQAVFDTSIITAVLFAGDSFDLTSLVRARLGLLSSDTRFSAQSSRFGFLNSAAIMTELPAVKQADDSLIALQSQLLKRADEMVQNYERELKMVQDQLERGELSLKQQEDETKRIEKKQEDIIKFEQDSVKQLSNKRAELYKPIFDNINQAITATARENDLQFIFDTSAGVLLYADPGMDTGESVKRKLGMGANSAQISDRPVKFGFLNSIAILNQMPAVRQANIDLGALQRRLEKQAEDMDKQFQLEFQETAGKVERGELSPKQQQEEEERLQKKQADIIKFKQDSAIQLENKRAELYKPISDNVNQAITATARENDLQFIFDTSAVVLLYADPALDLESSVRAKL